MNFSWFKQEKKKTLFLLDVSAASVGGALVEYIKGTRPKILWGKRVEYKPEPQGDFSALSKTITDLTKELTTEIHASRLAHPERCEIVLHPFLYTERPYTFQKKFVSQERVTRELIHRLTAESNTAIPAGHISLGQKALQVRLNGYYFSDPFGKQTQDIEIDVLGSSVSKILSEKLRITLRTLFPRAVQEIHTLSFLGFITLRDILLQGEDFVNVVVSDAATEIMKIDRGVVKAIETVSFGYSDCMNGIVSALTSSSDEASGMIKMYFEDKLRADLKVKALHASEEVGKRWSAELLTGLKKIGGGELLPQRLVLVAREKISPVLMRSLLTLPGAELTRLAQPFVLHSISASELRPLCDESPQFMKENDSFLMIEALALLRTHD